MTADQKQPVTPPKPAAHPASIPFDKLPIPVRTDRLLLRRPTTADIPHIARIANDTRITSTTASLPYPYTTEDARKFIDEIAPEAWTLGRACILAITEHGNTQNNNQTNTDGHTQPIGTVGLVTDWANLRAELGFWVGVDYWGRGYATEASRAMIRLAFEHLSLERVFATHHGGNDASGKVQIKAGMRYEGVMRKHLRKDGRQLDSVIHGLTRDDFISTNNTPENR